MLNKNKTPSRDVYQTPHQNPMLASRLPKWRSTLVVILMSCAFVALAGRALWVQVLNQDFYINEGQKRYQRTLELDGDARPDRRPQRRDARREPCHL